MTRTTATAPEEAQIELERQSLSRAAGHLLEECRMVLPGIQALFGFQLIVVFNDNFFEVLSLGEQRLHLLAAGLIVIAVAMIMTPAAYHRQVGIHHVTERFLVISTRLLLWSMAPLAVGICLDFYLILQLVMHHHLVAAAITVALLAVFILCWGVLPRLHRREYIAAKQRAAARHREPPE